MNVLGMMAKYWEPGRVKTRLAKSIGNDLAAELYRHFLQTLLQRFEKIADRRVLIYTPHDSAAEFASLAGPAWSLSAQAEGDLGNRMSTFLSETLAAGADRVVIIGADNPHLPLETIDQAFEKLNHHEVVLGPAEDGGYYLLGCRQLPPIFDDMPWSTPDVWKKTMHRLQQSHLRWEQLSMCYDVDTQADLLRLYADLASAEDDAPLGALRQVLATNQELFAARRQSND